MKFDETILKNRGYGSYIDEYNKNDDYVKTFSQIFEHAEDGEGRPYRGFIIVFNEFDNELEPFTVSARFMRKNGIDFNVEMNFCSCYSVDEIEDFFYDVFENMNCTLF